MFKKLTLALTALIMSLTLAACEGSEGEEGDEEDEGGYAYITQLA